MSTQKPANITDAVDSYVEKIHKDDEDRTLRIHVTDLSNCLCGVYYQKQGIQGDRSPAKLRRFEVGHKIEDFILEAILDTGDFELLPEHKQQIVWEDFNLVGTPDVVANYKKSPLLLEIKSIHPFALDKMTGVHPHYREQVNMYLHRLRQTYPNIVAKIVYFSLDGRMKEFDVEYNEFIAAEGFRKAKVLNDALMLGKPPEPAESVVIEDGKKKKNWVADYCMQDGIHRLCINQPDMTYNQWVYRVKKLL